MSDKLLNAMRDHGVTLDIDGKLYTKKLKRRPAPNLSTLSYPSLGAFVSFTRAVASEGSFFEVAGNHSIAKKSTDDRDSRTEWCEGKFADLTLENFEKTPLLDLVAIKKTELLETDIFADFLNSLKGAGLRRKRFFSEHDGEFIEDRALEIAPYAATKRTLAPIKLINLTAALSISGGVSASKIASYSATIAALAEILTDNGVQVGLSLELSHCEIADDQKTNKGELLTKVPVKRPDEFLPISALAAALSPNLYRRLGIFNSVIASEAIGRRAASGYGYVKNSRLEWIDSTLVIPSSNFFDEPNGETERIVKMIRKKLETQH